MVLALVLVLRLALALVHALHRDAVAALRRECSSAPARVLHAASPFPSRRPPAHRGCPPTAQCMDWTFGSSAMRRAEASYNGRSGSRPVYFGVGTYGTSDDAQQGLGACYRLSVAGVDRDLLLQSINTGSDVDGNQFDLQIGDGGAGAFNTCAGGASSMYPGNYTPWGKQYGGVDHRKDCANLPMYVRPHHATATGAQCARLVPGPVGGRAPRAPCVFVQHRALWTYPAHAHGLLCGF